MMNMVKCLSISTLLACLLVVSISCSNNNVGKISEIYTCKSIGDDQRPIEISSTFSPDSEIYFSFKSNVSCADGEDRVDFFFEVLRPEDDPEYREIYSEGRISPLCEGYNSVSIKHAHSEWGEGNFLIRLYLNDKQEGSITFSIQ